MADWILPAKVMEIRTGDVVLTVTDTEDGGLRLDARPAQADIVVDIEPFNAPGAAEETVSVRIVSKVPA